MPAPALRVVTAIFVGIGATLLSDLWALFLKSAFSFPVSSMCLVGRWILYMPDGVFCHSRLASAQSKRGECAAGWLAHYGIGIVFAGLFMALVGPAWLKKPALMPALCFGVVTSLAPFLIMQPAFGLGLASSRAASPWQARLRTLLNHLLFGLGLFASSILIPWLT